MCCLKKNNVQFATTLVTRQPGHFSVIFWNLRLTPVTISSLGTRITWKDWRENYFFINVMGLSYFDLGLKNNVSTSIFFNARAEQTCKRIDSNKWSRSKRVRRSPDRKWSPPSMDTHNTSKVIYCLLRCFTRRDKQILK